MSTWLWVLIIVVVLVLALGVVNGHQDFLVGGHEISWLMAIRGPGGWPSSLGEVRSVAPPLAGQGLGEPVAVALGQDQVGVVQQPVHRRCGQRLGHDLVEPAG